MAEQLVSILTGALAGSFNAEAVCFIISLFPVLELRGGLLAASPAFLDVPASFAVPLCIIGNLLPIPFVLILIERVLVMMEKIRLTSGFALWLRKKADKNKDKIVRYGFWGLVLFVGIPLPGTGAWTGSLVAALLHMPFRKAFCACIAGVLLASVIMCIVSYGILGTLFA